MESKKTRALLAEFCTNFWLDHWKGFLLLVILLVFIPLILLLILMEGGNNAVDSLRALFVYAFMAVLWLSRTIPIYVTGLLPVLFFPSWNMMQGDLLCQLYFRDVVGVFLGSMLMALAFEYSSLHQRIALSIIKLVGKKPCRILWTMIFISMFISMWISNGATTVMMCTVIRAIITDLEEEGVLDPYEKRNLNATEEEEPKSSRVASAFYLGVTYAAAIGGTGTLIGTGANLALKGQYEVRFPQSLDIINFSNFTIYTFPIVFLFTIFLCLWMQIVFFFKVSSKNVRGKVGSTQNSRVHALYKELPPFSMREVQIIILFVLLILILYTEGSNYSFGWKELFTKETKSSLPAIAIGLLLLVLPRNYKFLNYISGSAPYTEKETDSILSSKFTLQKIPWGYIFIIGGGFALSIGMMVSGLSRLLNEAFIPLGNMPLWSLQLLCITVVAVLSIFCSNVVVVSLSIPIINELAISISIHPLYLILPSGIVASYSFLLPLGSPANQYVIKYANIPIWHMIVAGIGPTIMGAVLVFLNGQVWHTLFFPAGDDFPMWALINREEISYI